MDKDGIAWPVPELQGLGIIWNDLVVAQDGSLYLTDTKNSRIWKRAVTGEVTVVAGTGNSGYSGDGAQANQAMLNEPSNVVVGPDGSIYIADTKNKRVRKIATDGIIQTMVGGDSSATEIYDGDANKAKIDINWIAIGSDEAIYIVTHAGGRIVQVDITGKMFSYFGNPLTNAADPTSYAKGDGGPVGLAELKCRRLKILNTKAGGKRFYLTEIDLPENFSGYKRKPGIVRVIDENNIINRVAGGGWDEYKSGVPAVNCHLADIEAISLDVNGNLFVASNKTFPYTPAQSRSRIQKIVNSYHDYTNQGILFPDPNGGLIYSFSPEGRHLKTYNSFTGKSILEFGYDASGKLSNITDAFGNATQIQRGANGFAASIVNPYGQTLNFENDASGNLTAISLPSNESHKFGYNLAGLMESYTTPRNQKHLFTYDEFGRLLKDEDPEGGFKTVLKSDIPGGNRTTIQTAMGRTSTYDLIYNPDMSTTQIDKDAAGLITKTVHPRNGIDTTFSPNGDNVFVTKGPEPQLLAPNQKVERKDYTSPNITGYSVTHTESVAFTDSTNPLSLSLYMAMTYRDISNTFRTTIYDNAIRKWTQDLDHIGIVSTFIDSLGREVEKRYPAIEPVKYSYDSRGRLASISQGSGQDNRTTFMNYNPEGYLSEIIDPLNRHQQFFYDLAGRVIRTVRPDGKEILYSYDADGNVTSITPPGETPHSFEYTSTGLESKYVPPALGKGEYRTGSIYNLDKQLLKILRPDSLAISVKYDSVGRVDSVLSNTRNSKYYYNSQTGKTDSLISSDGVKLGYTHAGPFIKKMNWTGPVSGKVSFTYFFGFSEWDPESQFLNDSDEVLTGRNTYDNIYFVGRFRTSMPYGPDFPFLNPMKYLRDTAQRLTGTTVINLKDSLVYNSFQEVKEYHARSATDSLFRCLYKRDKLGRITEKTETVQGVTHNYAYTYDMAGRLTEVRIDNSLTSTYSYDANGNRLTKVSSAGTDSGSYDAQDRLVKYGNDSYVYGRNGDVQRKYSGISFTDYNYDVFGNLLSVSLANGTTIEYIVDGQNRRIGKKVNGVLVQGLLYKNQINPVAELDANNKVVSRFVYGLKGNVPDQIFKGDSLTYRVISDQVGSVRMVVNAATGEVVQRMDYDEFGNVIYDSNPGFQPFGFAGGLYEPMTKLVRFGDRDYQASSGRWLSKDPIGFDGGMNHYVYCGNDPVNFMDSDGLASGDQWFGENDPNFQAWMHDQKPGLGRGAKDNFTKKEIRAGKKEWNKAGRPGKNKRNSGKSRHRDSCPKESENENSKSVENPEEIKAPENVPEPTPEPSVPMTTQELMPDMVVPDMVIPEIFIP